MRFVRTGTVIAIGLIGYLLIAQTGRAQTQMMGSMREMMQNMMGDRLPPGIDPALLPDPNSKGAHLLAQYCAQCHNLPGPGMHTSSEWPGVVGRMTTRMQMMGRMEIPMMGRIAAPNEGEIRAITDYLKHYAQRPIKDKSILQGRAGKAFSTTCAQCHVLPDPAQHTPNEWPSVVSRMKEYERVMGKIVPDEATTKEIISFLQQFGRRGK